MWVVFAVYGVRYFLQMTWDVQAWGFDFGVPSGLVWKPIPKVEFLIDDQAGLK